MPKKWLLIIVSVLVLIGAGFWAGYNYKAYQVRRAIKQAFSSTSNQDSSSTTTPQDSGYKFVMYKQGYVIHYATQTMKFNSAKSTTTLSSQYSSPLVADAGTKFVVVNHTVTNTTDSPYTYVAYTLFDKDKKQYNADTDAIVNIDNYLYGRELAPNVPETGVIVFKVPASTTGFIFGGLKGQTNEFHGVSFTVD